MNPPAPSASSKLARFMKREHCVWMASPGLALLAAMASARERPTRLLLLEGAPPFADEVAKMLGIPTTTIPETGARAALQAALRNPGSRTDVPWSIVTHRAHRLAPSEAMAAFANLASPTIELCLGGLFAIERPSQATITIASLDAEAALEGVHLAALLTDSSSVADELGRRLLPHSAAPAASVDFGPRGLSEDEAGLTCLIDRAIERAEAAEKDRKKQAAPSFSLTWKRLFEETQDREASPSSAVATAPAVSRPAGENPWLARLAEAERRHLESMAASASQLAQYRDQIEERQTAASEWERRAKDASATAEVAEKAHASVRNEKAQLEERLSSVQNEKAQLEESLASSVSMNEELRDRLQRIEADLRRQISGAADREASLKAEAEEQKAALQQSIAQLTSQIEDLNRQREFEAALREAALREADQAQGGLKTRLDQVERALAAAQGELLAARAQLGDTAEAHRRALEASETLMAETRQALAESRTARAADQAAHAKAIEVAEDRRRVLERDLAGAEEALRVRAKEGEAAQATLDARVLELERALSQAEEGREREEARAGAAAEAHRAVIQATETKLAVMREALAVTEASRAAERTGHAKSLQAAETGRALLEERVSELKETLRAQVQESEAARVTLNARVQELEQALSQAREDRERERARAGETTESHRSAMQAAEARLAAAREALAASEASRAAEQAGHLRSTQAAETGRATLEERISELKETLRAQVQEGEAARVTLNARVQELEQALSLAREDRGREQARAGEAAEAHRAALQAAEAKLAAAREALAASEASRAAEQTSHAKSAQAAEAGGAVLKERVAELKEALRIQTKEGETTRAALNARIQELERALSLAREDRDRAQARGVTTADRLAATREELASLKGARAASAEKWDPKPRGSELPSPTLPGEKGTLPLGRRRRTWDPTGPGYADDRGLPLAEMSKDGLDANPTATEAVTEARIPGSEEWMAEPPVWEARSANPSSPLERESSPPHEADGPSFEPEYGARHHAEEPDEAPQSGWLRGLTQRIRGG